MTTAQRLRAAANANMSLAGYEMDEAADELDRNQDTIAQLRAERDKFKSKLDTREKVFEAEVFARLQVVKEIADLKAKLAQVEADAAAMREAFDSPTGPYVLAFAVEMEKKLALNRHKGDREGWVNDDSLDLLARLKEETKELQDVLDNMANGVTVEAADVANFSMMIADHCEGLKPFKIPSSGQRLLDELASLKIALDLRTRERDECCKESKRTSQKWMDGLRELFGKDIDFDDPCSGKTLDDWKKNNEMELATLRATAQRRLELLRKCEWAAEGEITGTPKCAICGGYKQKSGHHPDCPLAGELSEAKPEQYTEPIHDHGAYGTAMKKEAK